MNEMDYGLKEMSEMDYDLEEINEMAGIAAMRVEGGGAKEALVLPFLLINIFLLLRNIGKNENNIFFSTIQQKETICFANAWKYM